MNKLLLFSLSLLTSLQFGFTALANPLVYQGKSGPGKGKHIVFIASDHEYRGEETCPALARILAKRYGFKCTVLFGLDENGHIKPGSSRIPGTEVIKDADMLFFFIRFLAPDDKTMQPIIDYLDKGGPVAGLRTTTHGSTVSRARTASTTITPAIRSTTGASAVRSSGKLGDPRKGRGIMAKITSTAPVCSWFPGKGSPRDAGSQGHACHVWSL